MAVAEFAVVCTVSLRRVRDGDNRSVDHIRGDVDPDRASKRSLETSAGMVASRSVQDDSSHHVHPARAVQVYRRTATHTRRPRLLTIITIIFRLPMTYEMNQNKLPS